MTTNATAAPAPVKVARFKYTGPLSGATLNVDGAPQEVMLFPDTEVDLPEEHEYVQTLKALGYLTLVAQSKAKKGEADAR